jgi:hypothetical protein
MGFKRVQVVGWVDEGESGGFPPGVGIPGFPDQGLPPGGEYPGQGLPIYPGQGLPPWWGGGRPSWPERPGQGLPWRPEYPGRPGQGLPWPGRPTDPGWGIEEGSPGQGLPEGGRLPKAQDFEDHPDEPGTDGQWLLAAYGSEIRWVFLPRNELPEVEPPDPERR